MHSKNDNIEIMMNDEAYEVIKKLFVSLENKYQNNLESVKDSEFVVDYVQLFHYKCHKQTQIVVDQIYIFLTGQKTKKQQ